MAKNWILAAFAAAAAVAALLFFRKTGTGGIPAGPSSGLPHGGAGPSGASTGQVLTTVGCVTGAEVASGGSAPVAGVIPICGWIGNVAGDKVGEAADTTWQGLRSGAQTVTDSVEGGASAVFSIF